VSKDNIKKKILVIEDDLRILKALSIRLKHAGYEVAAASDGLEGLKSAIEFKPDLIISDIWMPGSVGFLVAERIKAFGLGGIPVIFITGNKKKHVRLMAQDVGAAAFFEKPFDSEELLDAIARALSSPRKGARTGDSCSAKRAGKGGQARARARVRAREEVAHPHSFAGGAN
jgi:two-component system OmpR family response regulator